MSSAEDVELRAAEAPRIVRLDRGWEAACASPELEPASGAPDGLTWLPARVPGTAAGALRAAGLWTIEDDRDFDAEDWWFRTTFASGPAEPDEEVVLRLEGLATVAEVFLNGEPLLQSSSMFERHAVDVGGVLREENELLVRCRALGPLLRERRSPRARWRTRLVSEGNLRFFRTALIGRAPGFAPGPGPVGPYREVVLERRRGLAVDELKLRPRLENGDGVLAIVVQLRALGTFVPRAVVVDLDGPSGSHSVMLPLEVSGARATARGELSVPGVEPWWPHTHGDPALHAVSLRVEGDGSAVTLPAGRVGFRSVAPGPTPDHLPAEDGLDLHVNGVRVFARGAVWTPVDPVGLAPDEDALRETLETARDAGLNMIRVPGIGTYETPAFHDLCDELGLLVWQDFMYANLDYPFADEQFSLVAEREARQVSTGLAGRPSVAVLCGNSEVEQQVAMLGLDPAMGRGPFFGETLPTIAADAGLDAPYVPSAPCGGDLPFRTDCGVANYFGVGAYLRPLEDARRAEVRFASECLAFSNVPDGVEDVPLDDPRWKRGVPRDAGADWDFEDVRDHYLELLYGVDAGELRSRDPSRYLELSRAVTGEVMAEVMGEWRRAGSPCGGGLVLWLRDLYRSAGWGLLDSTGRPKLALRSLARVLSPVAVWTTDEGLNGIAVHVANDRPEPLDARLRVALYRDLEVRVDSGDEELVLPPRSSCERGVEALLGHFADAALAYRFGPPSHHAVVASLERGGDLLGQAVRFPAGHPLEREPAERLGLEVSAGPGEAGRVVVTLGCGRLVWGVRLQATGYEPRDDGFTLEPGCERRIEMQATSGDHEPPAIRVTALNLDGIVRVGPAETR